MPAQASARTILVTGGSRGIGAAVVRAFAAHGDTVVALSRSGAHPCLERPNVRAVACDVLDPAAVERALATVGPLDILINNAGIIEPIVHLAEADPAEWSRTIRSNLDGAFFVIRHALPGMLARRRGLIINISSGAAARPLEGWSAYCASKAGLAMLTQCVQQEYGDAGIVCIGFRPGVVDTGMQASIRQSGLNPVSRIPRENLLPPEEVADALVWIGAHPGKLQGGAEISIQDEAFRQMWKAG